MEPYQDHVAVIRRGLFSGLTAVFILWSAAVPARLSLALRGWGSLWQKAERVFAGSLLDLSAVAWLAASLVGVLTVLSPLMFRSVRGARWQRWGALVWALPVGSLLWLFTVMAQEVKSERGSFPTMFDVLEGGTNASFLEGSLGFLGYVRVWLPAVVGLATVVLIILLVWRRPVGAVGPWRSWLGGLSLGLIAATALTWGLTFTLSSSANRFTSAALGDPLTGLIESTVDLFRHQGPATPRELVLGAELPVENKAQGAQLLGWPKEAAEHLPRRPLDFLKEPQTRDPRGTALLKAFHKVGEALFSTADPHVAVFQLSLEGFRADDIHALNPQASRQLAPFVNSLYEGKGGVLTATQMFQAGVRTAHGLGAMTCGLGTLPYNLSFIRDLQPFPVRCAPDVLHDAGFAHSFFYGSDSSFDEMNRFFAAHGFSHLVSQAEMPADAPKGTWEGITDFAVFDRAVSDVKQALSEQSQFAFVMSLSNHSPFTAPQDLPDEVRARVEASLREAVNRADADDKLRLLTYSYTDAAVERLVNQLEASGIADRSIVILMADHSTGHAYVWGAVDPETDAAKAQIPFAIIIPQQFLDRAADPAKLTTALTDAQRLLNEAPLSLNDVPALLLALMGAHPQVRGLPENARWHTLGGQVTSPYFTPGKEAGAYILGINGVSELFVLNRQGVRVGNYEDSVFLKTRADRYRVTPTLIPVTATLTETMKAVTQ